MRTMTTNNLDEHVLSINDYYEAHDQVGKAKKRVEKGKGSKKDRAILTLAADSIAAHRSADLLRSVVMPSSGVPQIDPDTIDRLKQFRSMVAQGLRVARDGTLIGETVAVEAILSDFETLFTEELTR